MKPASPFKLSSSQVILIGFLTVILIGTGLLMLPISATGEAASFTTALFTATTSTCVTGLVVVPTVGWSLFGQVVILLLIQIGGLGVVAVISMIVLAFQKKMGFANRRILQDAFNLNSLSGLLSFLKKVILGTLAVEAAGAVCFMFVFVPQFGLRGIWVSVFHAVSAFCNAGMDIIGENSLINYVTHPVINLVTMALIVLGGLGYIVWWDVLRVLKSKGLRKKLWRNLTLHSKLAITVTLVLIFGGAAGVLLFEYDNPQTLGNLPLSGKIWASLFQSVTTRTAGFASVPQEHLKTPTVLLSMVLMFIGGSPVGTAGGIKTVTFAVLLLSAMAQVVGKNEVTVFHRRLTREAVSKAVAVAVISLLITVSATIALSLTTDRPLSDVLYEIVSATATVGLSRNLTPTLSAAGRLIVVAAMYFGRVGPISLAVSFNLGRNTPNTIKEPVEEINVG